MVSAFGFKFVNGVHHISHQGFNALNVHTLIWGQNASLSQPNGDPQRVLDWPKFHCV